MAKGMLCMFCTCHPQVYWEAPIGRDARIDLRSVPKLGSELDMSHCSSPCYDLGWSCRGWSDREITQLCNVGSHVIQLQQAIQSYAATQTSHAQTTHYSLKVCRKTQHDNNQTVIPTGRCLAVTCTQCSGLMRCGGTSRQSCVTKGN